MTGKGIYAKDTNISPDESLQEIRRILKRYNATHFALLDSEENIVIAFEIHNRRIRFVLPLPLSDEVRYANGGPYGNKGDLNIKGYEQAIRQKWRALALCIKAKLESVESGIETLEDAFMAQLVLASGQTVSEWAKPQIETMFSSGEMPPLLGSGK